MFHADGDSDTALNEENKTLKSLKTDERKFKLETASIGLPGALKHVLDGQEMPKSDFNVPHDLKNLLDVLQASKQQKNTYKQTKLNSSSKPQQ